MSSQNSNGQEDGSCLYRRRSSFRGMMTECFSQTEYPYESLTFGGPIIPRGIECKKHGVVKYMQGDYKRNSKWTKSHMLLLKRPFNDAIEFQSINKGDEPEDGMLTSILTEPLETTTDYPRHTFVLKYEDRVDFVVKTKDEEELNSWLSVIRDSMSDFIRREKYETEEKKSTGRGLCIGLGIRIVITEPTDEGECFLGSSNDPVAGPSSSSWATPLPTPLPETEHVIIYPFRSRRGRRSIVDELWEVELPTRISESVAKSWHNQKSEDERRMELCSSFEDYAWFHGKLSREGAENLVLHGQQRAGQFGHGTFLVRHSVTRPGEFILTVNFNGRVKHLQIRITRTCKLHIGGLNVDFKSVSGMFRYFQHYPICFGGPNRIPIDLTNFVVRPGYSPFPGLPR